jgi:hypothetical protein
MSFFFYAFRSVKFPNLRYKGKTVETQYIRKRGVKPGTKPGLRDDLARHAEGKPELSDSKKIILIIIFFKKIQIQILTSHPPSLQKSDRALRPSPISPESRPGRLAPSP